VQHSLTAAKHVNRLTYGKSTLAPHNAVDGRIFWVEYFCSGDWPNTEADRKNVRALSPIENVNKPNVAHFTPVVSIGWIT